ncbi:MAG: deoxyribodipyrimidine photo-lyase, partial [Nitrospira sp.]|nr:deoxyribodipyrimidine photo-lyase [Nitrospira sp.]
MTDAPSIVLFQTDLRLADNPAVTAAVRRGSPLLCVYVWNPHATGYDRPGAASRWWLHHSLQSLATTLRQAGNALILRRGTSEEVLRDILKTYQAPHVFWNRTCEPGAVTN